MARYALETQALNGKHGQIWLRVKGWDIGIEVECKIDERNNEFIEIFKVGGVGSSEPKKLIKRIEGRIR